MLVLFSFSFPFSNYMQNESPIQFTRKVNSVNFSLIIIKQCLINITKWPFFRCRMLKIKTTTTYVPWYTQRRWLGAVVDNLPVSVCVMRTAYWTKKIAINISPKLLLVSQSNLHTTVLLCMCVGLCLFRSLCDRLSRSLIIPCFLSLFVSLHTVVNLVLIFFFWMHIIWAVHRLTVNMCCIVGVDSYFFPRLRFHHRCFFLDRLTIFSLLLLYTMFEFSCCFPFAFYSFIR